MPRSKKAGSKTEPKSRIPSLTGDGKKDGQGKDGGASNGENAQPNHEDGIGMILAKLATMDGKFDELKTEVREAIQAVDHKVGLVEERIDTVTKKSDKNEERLKEVADASEGLRVRSSVHGSRLADVEKKIERLEREKRKNLIIIEGVPESEENPSPEIVDLLFRDLKLDFDTLVCDRIYRRGKAPPGTGEGAKPEVAPEARTGHKPRKHRVIVVGFKELSDKIQVYKHVKNLQGLDKWKNVFISDDLTECQQNEVRDLRALSAYARSKGYNSTVRANCIIVNDRRYAYGEIARLGPELTLERAKTIECLDGKGIGFQSVHSPLSNLFPCNIIYKKRPFLSAEGALQYTRAIICKRYDEAATIEFERNAYEVKRIAASLGQSQQWDNMVEDVLLEILIIKFTTNQRCRNALLATGEKRLFEATGDKVWACGLPLSKIHELTLPPPGRNRTGLSVEKVRDIIRNEGK